MSKNKDNDELYFDGELESEETNSPGGANDPVDPNESPHDSGGGVSPDEVDDNNYNNDYGDTDNNATNEQNEDNSLDNDNDEDSENNNEHQDGSDEDNKDNQDVNSDNQDSNDPNVNATDENDAGNEDGVDVNDGDESNNDDLGTNVDGQNDSNDSAMDPYHGDSEDGAESGEDNELGTNPELYGNENDGNQTDADKDGDSKDGLGNEGSGNDSDDEFGKTGANQDNSANDALGKDGDQNDNNNSTSGDQSDNADGDVDAKNKGNTDDNPNSKDASDNEDGMASGGDKDLSNIGDRGGESNDKLSGLKDKLGDYSDTADKLNKAESLKNISKMKKEQAAKEAAEFGKEMIVQKIKWSIITAIGPYILPIIGILLVILILFISIMGALEGSKPEDYVAKQCNSQDKDSGGKDDVATSGNTEKNAKQIYKFLMENIKGLTPKQAAGIMGAITFESQLDTNALNSSSGAYGIAQWLGPRVSKLESFAKEHHGKKSDLDIQLKFLLSEIQGDYEYAQLKSQGFFEADSIDKAMRAWLHGFERAGPNENFYEQRLAYGKKWYAKFSDMKIDKSKAKDLGKSSKSDNISDSEDAASDNSNKSSACTGGEDTDIKGELGDSVKANGGSGKIIKDFGSTVPSKYKKYIKIPKLDEKYLAKSSFGAFGCEGQCTELTWVYMSQMWTGSQPSNGNGHDLAGAYKAHGAKTTHNPTVGYGFSSDPPYAGSGDASTGHTGVVAGVLPDGKWILANYNLHLEAPKRHLTYALVDGNPKHGGATFFSGVGKIKKQYKK